MEKYQSLDLNDYVQSGEGGTALTYSSKDGKTLAKLFQKGYSAQTAEREFLIADAVYKAGIPSPRPIRLVTDGERFGGEYELIVGKRSYARIISEEPDKMEPLSVKLAGLALQLHNTPADSAVFPSMNEVVRPWVEKSERIPEDLRPRLLEALDSIPSPRTCLHGDLHIGNIITDGKKDYWIDLGEFAYGAPEWDLSFIYFSGYFLDRKSCMWLYHLEPGQLREHWNIFVNAYFSFHSPEEQKAYERSLFKFAALRTVAYFGKLNGGKGTPDPYMVQLVGQLLDGAVPGVSEL